MAAQRLTIATLAGQAATAAHAQFERWRALPDPAAVDRFCAAVREHSLCLPVVYFAEWVDRWLMGDKVPGPNKVQGHQFEAACMLPKEAAAWADQCGHQFAEQEWLSARLREAAVGYGAVAEQYAVVVLREIFGPSTTDDEVRASLSTVPKWLFPAGDSTSL